MKFLSKFFLIIFGFALFAFTGFAAGHSKPNLDLNTKSSSIPILAKDVVDINHADFDTLKTLKGIGKKKAEAIINYRQQHGRFKTMDDLALVEGFNQKVIARLLKSNPQRIKLTP